MMVLPRSSAGRVTLSRPLFDGHIALAAGVQPRLCIFTFHPSSIDFSPPLYFTGAGRLSNAEARRWLGLRQ